MSCFIDTSAFLAVMAADDAHHTKAVEIWNQLLENGTQLTTSNYVLLETIALAQHRFGLESVRSFQENVTPILAIEWIDASVHQTATSVILTAGRRKLSLVDATSFEVMRNLAIRRVFSFDKHFKEQGFELTP